MPTHPHLPQPSHRVGATHTIDSLKLVDHWFTVPLTHGLIYGKGEAAALDSRFASQTITVFAREVIDTSDALTTPVDERPYMVYLQGGPGGKSPRPISEGGWVHELAKTHRLILLDQRGTGNSTPLSARVITAQGSPEVQAEFCELFRADSIIADAEVVREFLLADRHDKRWSTMGQSFGGFLTLSYLSFAPQSVKDSRMTAGLAPIRSHVDEVYRSTLDRMKERTEEYYGWYPEDRELAVRISEHLVKNEEYLPTGERLTPHRFQMLGNILGGNGRARGLHYVLESAFAESESWLSDQFLTEVSAQVSFQSGPLYGLLHETIYADGPAQELGGTSPSASPTNWSAARMYAERPDFAEEASPLLLTGEHIFPWYYEEDPALRPLAEVAQLLAEKKDWGRLYDHDQLARNEVPLVAAAYVPDVYVDYAHSMKTAEFVGNTRVWTSKTHHHDGLGADGPLILSHLKNLLADMR
ncbi:MAG: alpha/beta fold hydrolase [Rothia sp. (in: high G+C Gram-positive bacteria)]|uniref:alpha/beta fold hydrolase n=1 Tax=Rothia sp. (in: high G+C Gram-positive bacteria) TaxID=1885016 RepID=UPI00270DB38C|nr:alpha/beta fold hydrolase [Rothia sp. (in: high G+C Gram-positive bacteria)]